MKYRFVFQIVESEMNKFINFESMTIKKKIIEFKYMSYMDRPTPHLVHTCCKLNNTNLNIPTN